MIDLEEDLGHGRIEKRRCEVIVVRGKTMFFQDFESRIVEIWLKSMLFFDFLIRHWVFWFRKIR